jgi:putative hydrolase of the HAD superfamily
MIKIKNALHSRVKGIFFDYGGVLEDLKFSETSFNKGAHFLHAVLGSKGIEITIERLITALKQGQEEYNGWYKKNNYVELSTEEMWTFFYLKDICKEKKIKESVEEISEELSSIYEFYLYRRRQARDLRTVLKTLFYSGYILALVSNTISKTLIPERLKKFNVDSYFSTIVLSVDIGVRKPRIEIFDIALKRTNLSSQDCIYIGDTMSRDVEGSKNAGFLSSILIQSGLTEVKDSDYKGVMNPDKRLNLLKELFEILQ